MSSSNGVSLDDAVCGFVGSVFCVYAGLPFDVVKIRMQTAAAAADVRFYSGPLDCFSKILRGEGVTAFWRGAIPACASAMIENTVVFAANGVFRRHFIKMNGDDAATDHRKIELKPWQMYASGALAGFFSATAMCPAEVVKCRLQFQRDAMYTGALDCISKIVRTEGTSTLYRGLPALYARDIPFNCVFFGSYELIVSMQMRALGRTKDELSAAHIFLAGGLAGSIGWGTIFPFDTIKSRMQGPQGGTVPKTFLGAYRAVVASGGHRALFRGWVPAVV